MNYVRAEYNLLSLHEAVLFNDLRRLWVLYITSLSVWQRVLFPLSCVALQSFSLAPHSSFNSNSLPISDSSPPYIVIFSLVTFSLCQISISLHPLPTTTTSPSAPGPLTPFPFVSCCPPLHHCGIFPLLFYVHGFLLLSHIYFISLQDLRHFLVSSSSCHLSPHPTCLSFTPICTFSLSHLLLYSSQLWVSDLNLSLCIRASPFCSSGTPLKTNRVDATFPRMASFVCLSESVCNWTWNDKVAGLCMSKIEVLLTWLQLVCFCLWKPVCQRWLRVCVCNFFTVCLSVC